MLTFDSIDTVMLIDFDVSGFLGHDGLVCVQYVNVNVNLWGERVGRVGGSGRHDSWSCGLEDKLSLMGCRSAWT